MGSFDPHRISVDEEAVVGRTCAGADLDGHEYRVQAGSMNGDRKQDESTIAYEIRSERLGENIFVVSLVGEHDLYTAPRVEEELSSVTGDGARTTIVDLSETTFLDSTMLNVFLRVRHELRDGNRLLLVTNDATVKRVFEIAGIDRFFDFFPSRRAAEAEAAVRLK